MLFLSCFLNLICQRTPTFARLNGFEPLTLGFGIRCSTSWSYRRIFELIKPTLRQGNSIQCFLRSQNRTRTCKLCYCGSLRLPTHSHSIIVLSVYTIPPPNYVKEPEVLACSVYTDCEACGYRLFVVPPGIEPDFPG